MSNKKNLIIVGIVILLAIIIGIIFFVNKNESEEINDVIDSTQEESYTEDEEEEVEIEHNLKLSIISPEEENIFPSQARMYNALIEGNGKYSSNTVKCHWEFFLNEYNEEVLYKVMDVPGVLEKESKEICGFTSSFMDRMGKLRVVLTVTITNYLDETLETVTAERTYTVTK